MTPSRALKSVRAEDKISGANPPIYETVLSTPVKKAVLLACVWGFALVISALVRLWGVQHPLPLEVSATPVLLLLLMPAALMGGWLLMASRGSGESE